MVRHYVVFLTLILFTSYNLVRSEDRPANIVYIMCDELAYFELGHMGNPYLKTPNIDRMAKEGIRFTNALAASPVCGPLRGCLMTGKHAGHASVRANDGGTPLRDGEVTIASMLKQKNYATGGFGKWGIGGRDSTGVPEKHGFDEFFGYYDQVHAHSFYPPYLIYNSEEVVLPGNEGGRSGGTYSHYKIMESGLSFIRKNKDQPFFAYFPITPPHGMYDIPSDDPAWDQYEGEEWIEDPGLSQNVKNYAAMVTMIDNNLGSVLELLKELDLEEETIVFFTGDNGGEDRFGSKSKPRGFFGPNVNPETGIGFRGAKRYLYEGGLKIPFLVRWPGKIEAGRVSDHVFAQYDIMATLADVSNTMAPEDNDGISIMPTILGDTANQSKHEMLYWEYNEQVAVRWGDWKAIQPGKDKNWELYDLSKDVSESNSIAADHSDVLDKMKQFAKAAHTPVEIGTYSDPERVRHEKDRKAKWGTTRNEDRSKRTNNKILGKELLPVNSMSLVSYSSESMQSDWLAEYAIDGKIHTTWQTQNDEDDKPPRQIVIDLGKPRKVKQVHYLARQDGIWDGTFSSTEFYLSNSSLEFPKTPSAVTVFGKVRTAQAVTIAADAPPARYLMVKSLSNIGSSDSASAAEIRVSVEGGGQDDAVVVASPQGEQFKDLPLFNLDAWNKTESWAYAKEITGGSEAKQWTSVTPGEGILYNKVEKDKKSANLKSKASFGDSRLRVEFKIPKGSNSGIYFQDRYEIQILDSFGKTDELKHGDNGGIYQRWNAEAPKGEQGFEGTAPSSNQSKAPGEWQSFDISFQAPKFDSNGKKLTNAKFVSVIHNGEEIHSNVELTGPTRGGVDGPEVAVAPFRIQGDHGPVAFRKFELIDSELAKQEAVAFEAKARAIENAVIAELGKTELDVKKKRQLQSMTMAAYRKNLLAPLWNNSLAIQTTLRSMEAILEKHGFSEEEARLSFSLIEEGAEEEYAKANPETQISTGDLLNTLILSEACLRLKQGPASDSSWPNWAYGDEPFSTSSSKHYDEITTRFGKVAANSESPFMVASDFIPKNWVYQSLFKQIDHSKNAPESPKLNVSSLIKIGNDFDQAKVLGEYLNRLGHLSDEHLAAIGTKYTSELSAALKLYQSSKGLQSDGILGPKTAANISSINDWEVKKLTTNLHRARRLPDNPGERYLLANLPSAQVHGFDNGKETINMRIVFGKNKLGQRTPLFRDKMELMVFRPYWNVPYSISQEKLYSDLGYLSRNGFQIISSSSGRAMPMTQSSLNSVSSRSCYIRQNAGTNNALGLVKFLFPNSHAVYFHDTPYKHYFKSDYRAQSHGCVRLADPEKMANWVLDKDEEWDSDKINYAIFKGEREEVHLEKDIPVFLVYFTAFPNPSKQNTVGFYRDYYDYDKPGAEIDAPAPPPTPRPVVIAKKTTTQKPSTTEKKSPFGGNNSATKVPKRRGLFDRIRRGIRGNN